MNGEKVKEIKNALECWQESVMLSTDENYVSHRVTNREILDYINELESENKKLEQHKRELQGGQQDLTKRIAELEKKNAKLLDSVETVQSNRCVYKCVLTKEHLTKFAERLIEKKIKLGDRFNIYDIDETLKECLCDNNQ